MRIIGRMVVAKPVMKTGLKLVCDVDGVLVNFTKGFSQWVKAVKPELLPIDQTRWDFGMGNKSWDIVKEYWASTEFAAGLEYFPGAKQGINELAKMFELHIVTALDARYKSIRAKNLSGVHYQTLTVKAEKIAHILSLKPTVGIEDKPSNIKKMSAAGIDVYYPVIPLTQGVSTGTSYRNWKQLVSIIKKKYA